MVRGALYPRILSGADNVTQTNYMSLQKEFIGESDLISEKCFDSAILWTAFCSEK